MVTAADAPNRFEDSSRPLAGNNETQQLTQALLETLKTNSRSTWRGFHAQKPKLSRSPKKKGGSPRRIWTGLIQIIPQADELIERMREACRTAGSRSRGIDAGTDAFMDAYFGGV